MSESKKRSLFSNRTFLLLWTAVFLGGMGGGISKMALLWLGYKLTGSGTGMGALFICLTLPGIFIGPLSGSLADRFPKQRLLVASRLMIASCAPWYVLALHTESLALVYFLTAMIGVAVSFSGGPLQAALPELFGPDELSEVNAALQGNRSLTMVLGPAVGGLFLGADLPEWNFIIDAINSLVVAGLFALLPPVTTRLSDGVVTVRQIMSDIRSGFSYMANSTIHRFLLKFFVSLIGIYCLSGGLIMPFCEDILGKANGIRGNTALAVLQTVMGAGSFLGSFLIAPLMARIGELRTLMLGAALCVAELFAMGIFTNIHVLSAVLVVTASSMPMLMVPLFTLMQERSKPQFIGRAMGALDTLVLAAVSLAFGMGGILADWIGLLPTFLATGTAMLLVVITLPFLHDYRAASRQAGR